MWSFREKIKLDTEDGPVTVPDQFDKVNDGDVFPVINADGVKVEAIFDERERRVLIL